MKIKEGGISMESTFGFVPMLVISAIMIVLIMSYFFFHHWAK